MEETKVVGRFDLNIESILESWEPYHALREIIANAIDEQLLTQSAEPKIYKDDYSNWCIQDFGRGLKYTHLTQNENDEKLRNPNTIGKFGIGLKDALATLDRHDISVLAKSKFGDIRLTRSQKQDFADIITLHASIAEPSEPNLVGTKFVLSGILDDQVVKAKDLFLRFSGEKIIEKTGYGEIVEKRGSIASVYINGVKVASEENFLFSYNITSLNAAIKKALNRERTNVGRSAYTDRVKSILLSSSSIDVAQFLADDLQNYSHGNQHDELNWLDVQEHAGKILNQNQKAVFVTPDEIIMRPNVIEEAKNAGYRIVAVPDNLQARIHGTKDYEGNTVTDLSRFVTVYNASFEFRFVELNDLSSAEQYVYGFTKQIFDLAGGQPEIVKNLKISETMRKEIYSNHETHGVWEPSTGTIVIKRTQLSSLTNYAGTLLHEIIHAQSGFGDVSRDFEMKLTELLGIICAIALERPKKPSLFKRFFN